MEVELELAQDHSRYISADDATMDWYVEPASVVPLCKFVDPHFPGINFIFYYSTPFLQSTGAIPNTFLISLIFNLIDTVCTPISFFTMEIVGRRTLLIWGAFGMAICQYIIAIVGVTVGFNKTHTITLPDGTTGTRANNTAAVNAQIAFIAIYIFFFAASWGPGAWIVIGEIFPLPIRSRGVALSTASNWLWNTVRAVPFIVHTHLQHPPANP